MEFGLNQAWNKVIVSCVFVRKYSWAGVSAHEYFRTRWIRTSRQFYFRPDTLHVRNYKSPRSRSHRPLFGWCPTYLEFYVHAWFFSTLPDLAFPVSVFHYQPKKEICLLWLWALIYDLHLQIDLDKVKMSHRTKYLGQRSLRSTIIARTQTDKHTAVLYRPTAVPELQSGRK